MTDSVGFDSKVWVTKMAVLYALLHVILLTANSSAGSLCHGSNACQPAEVVHIGCSGTEALSKSDWLQSAVMSAATCRSNQ
jgi:hypothetical protein